MDEILLDLQNKGYRITKSRISLIEIFFFNQDKHFNLDQIICLLESKDKKINKMSLYNNIKTLLKEEIIKESIFNGKKIYEYNEVNHSHFYCKGCGEQIDLDYEELFDLNDKVEKKYNIDIESTKVEFFGYCPNCKE